MYFVIGKAKSTLDAHKNSISKQFNTFKEAQDWMYAHCHDSNFSFMVCEVQGPIVQ